MLLVFGVILFLFIISLLVNALFGVGCGGDKECLEAKQELENLASDLNEQCDGSMGSMSAAEDFGDYNFGASQIIVFNEPNKIQLLKLEDDLSELGYSKKDFLMGRKFEDQWIKWRTKVTVDKCGYVNTCSYAGLDIGSAKDCDYTFDQTQRIPFAFVGGSSGTFEYYFPEEDRVNLKWNGDNAIGE